MNLSGHTTMLGPLLSFALVLCPLDLSAQEHSPPLLTGSLPSAESVDDADSPMSPPTFGHSPSQLCDDICADESPATLLPEDNLVDRLFDSTLGWKNDHDIPITIGAWHWYAWDLTSNRAGGYGIPNLRGTYWWEVIATPEHDLGCGRKAGAVLNYRLRDGDYFRSFFDSKFWSYENYGWYSSEELGKVKAGQIWKRFGLDWDGVFFGNVPYFDGFKLDPDYGLSWEKTTEIRDGVKVDSYVQFYFHEDGVNGSFEGGDAESVPGIHERNTGVFRLVPTWTYCDGATLALGFSGLVGQIDSERRDIADENIGAWAADATYTKDNWKVFGEVLQSYGRINLARYVSGGPSNRITNMLVGAHYVRGPVTYRASYSLGIDDNPHATNSLVIAGATIKILK